MLSSFHDDLLKDSQIKDLIKALLQKGTRNSRTVRRIRSSPDLLVYDEEKKDLMLVEVKMRGAPRETSVKYLKRIADYKEFWDDSILVVIVSCGNAIYAQKVSELEVKQTYNATTDFERFEDVFTRVKTEDISHYREMALQIKER